MTPAQSSNGSSWARRLDWWERILSVLALPILGVIFAWANNVELRLNGQGAAIGLLQQELKHADQGRTEILERLTEVASRQVEVLQRLSRIEALVQEKR